MVEAYKRPVTCVEETVQCQPYIDWLYIDMLIMLSRAGKNKTKLFDLPHGQRSVLHSLKDDLLCKCIICSIIGK